MKYTCIELIDDANAWLKKMTRQVVLWSVISAACIALFVWGYISRSGGLGSIGMLGLAISLMILGFYISDRRDARKTLVLKQVQERLRVLERKNSNGESVDPDELKSLRFAEIFILSDNEHNDDIEDFEFERRTSEIEHRKNLKKELRKLVKKESEGIQIDIDRKEALEKEIRDIAMEELEEELNLSPLLSD